MKHLKLLSLSFIFSFISLHAQLHVVSTTPLNGAFNVAAGQNISVTFNEPLDTTMNFNEQNYIVNNIHLNGAETYSFSADHKTITFTAQTVADKDYSFCFYGLRSESGDTLAAPYLYRFTTETAFTGVFVRGTVASCDTNVNLGHTMIALLDGRIGADSSRPVLVTLANSNGSYTLPYVKNGAYTAVAVNDVSNDGKLDFPPDLLAFVDSVTVQSADVDSLNFYFPCPVHYSFQEIVTKVDSFAQTVIPDFSNYTLIEVASWDVNPGGDFFEYDFYYRNNSNYTVWCDISYNNFLTDSFSAEFNDFSDWFTGTLEPLGNLVFSAVSPDSFLAAAEENGGAAFRARNIPPGFVLDIQMELGQIGNRGYDDIVPDPNGIYWGVEYRIHEEYNWDNTLALFRVIADYQTGDILVIDDVNNARQEIPEKFELSQNYPNPFSKSSGENGTTTIQYSIPIVRAKNFSPQRNVQLKIYDVLGREIETLVNKMQAPGNYHVTFKAADLPAGIYFYTLRVGDFASTKKMVLIK